MNRHPNFNQRNQAALDQENACDHLMQIESPIQPQAQQTLSKQDQQMVKRLLYFMKRAYERVIDTFNDCLHIIHSGQGNLDHDLLKLNLLIDNAFIQFQSCQEKFPKSLKENFHQTVTKMRENTGKFHHEFPLEGRQVLDNHFKRFQTVLELKPLELTEVPKVDGIDPNKLLEIFYTMQKTYCTQDHELEQLYKKDSLLIPEFNSKPAVCVEFETR